MKKKRVLALILALIFMFISAVPSYAIEGDVFPDPGQEETDPIQNPEDPPVLPENPEEPENLEEPDEEEPENPEPPFEESEDEILPGEEEPSDEDDPNMDVFGEENLDEGEDEPLIDVLVPVSGQVVVNPYGMKVETGYGETTDQIVHEPQELVSFTDFPVQVSAQVVGTLRPWSAARFVYIPPTYDTRDKEIFMYVEFQPDPTQWSYTYGDWDNQILVMDWWAEKENVMTLDSYGVGYFRLFGTMTPYPEEMWTEDDAIMDVTIAFTFAPVRMEEEELFVPETPEEIFDDPMFNEFPNDGFDGTQTEEVEPFPDDIIPESAPEQNPEFIPEWDLESDIVEDLEPSEDTDPLIDPEQGEPVIVFE